MKIRRIKLICWSCGTILKWREDPIMKGKIEVEPCPECVGKLTKQQREMYERGKESALDNFEKLTHITDDLGTTHEEAQGMVMENEDINYGC